MQEGRSSGVDLSMNEPAPDSATAASGEVRFIVEPGNMDGDDALILERSSSGDGVEESQVDAATGLAVEDAQGTDRDNASVDQLQQQEKLHQKNPSTLTETFPTSTLELDMALLAHRKALFEHYYHQGSLQARKQQNEMGNRFQNSHVVNKASTVTDDDGGNLDAKKNSDSDVRLVENKAGEEVVGADNFSSVCSVGLRSVNSYSKTDGRQIEMIEQEGDDASSSVCSLGMRSANAYSKSDVRQTMEEGAGDSSTIFDISSMNPAFGNGCGDGNQNGFAEGGDEDGKSVDPDTMSHLYTREASPDSVFDQYHVIVDPGQDDKAVDIPLYSMKRPHMRAFHLAWIAFFVAFFAWFAMTPLLGDISRTLDLSREEIWTSSVLAVASSAITRVLMGPLCDRFGARCIMAGTLLACAIPTGLAGWLIQDATSLYLTRFFIGMAGSAFVTCQAWMASMFSREISGTAMALCAGWGNLAGGVCQIVMGSLLFPLFKVIYGGSGYENSHRESASSSTDDEVDVVDPTTADDEVFDRPAELSWRTILVFPAIASVLMAWAVVRYGDDMPKGNVNSRRRRNLVDQVSIWKSFRQAAASPNTWVFFVHYACCFGVEITMTQAAALYFQEEFGQPTESAAAIASVFGWMNLFARGLGGFASDMANARSGLRGRLWCQFFMLICEGALVVLFAHTHALASAIVVMIIFSLFVQLAEGSTFAFVPYVADPKVTGSVAGLVGAGGNVGGVGFALLFRALSYRTAFMYMGFCVICCALGTLCVAIPGHRGLVRGEDAPSILEHRRKAKIPEVIVIQRPSPSMISPSPGDQTTVELDIEDRGQ